MGVAILRSAGSEGLDLSESMRFLSNPPQLTSNIISINATKSTVADCGIKSNKFTAAEMPPPNKFDSNEQVLLLSFGRVGRKEAYLTVVNGILLFICVNVVLSSQRPMVNNHRSITRFPLPRPISPRLLVICPTLIH